MLFYGRNDVLVVFGQLDSESFELACRGEGVVGWIVKTSWVVLNLAIRDIDITN